jgi:gamma-glutamylcyclotransferase
MAKLPIFSAPQHAAEADFNWFVYGSSLDFDALASWCAEHGYRPPDLARATPARLRGWRLAFNVRSNFWGGLVASLVPDATATVEGILLPLSGSALGFVRHKEGVVSSLFEEHDGTADTAAGPQPCRVYVAAPGRIVAEGPPSPRFLETLLKGARERGLSPRWIASLEAATSASSG